MNPPYPSSALNGVTTLLFDLGQVIINLDFNATESAFKNIFGPDYQLLKQRSTVEEVFERYETGHISEADFLQALQALTEKQLDSSLLIQAWNAMLLDIPQPRLQMLDILRKRYKVMLLSNTNATHLDHVYRYLKTTYNISAWEDQYFDHAYYSHLMGLRKPHREIYEAVLNDHQLRPEQVLFIDDNADNITGANALGIKTLHHNPEQDITYIFQNFL
jgi:putative hydrolase of the HAD superfamily